MARLSIESKDVEKLGFDLGQHLYLVYENDAGNEFVIRGGPENNSVTNFGSIVVEVGSPINESEDWRGDETPEDRGNVTIDLGGRNPEDVWSLMKDQAGEINKKSLDYEAISQNSNSVVSSVLYTAGIDPLSVSPDNGDSFTGRDNYLDVESILDGTDRSDKIWGYTENDVLRGWEGNDAIDGGDGNDSLYGGGGNDILSGGWGFDLINGGLGSDTVDYSFYTSSNGLNVNLGSGLVAFRPAHSSTDGTVEKVVGIENVIGGGGSDLLTGSGAANNMQGKNGNDVVLGAGGDDWMYGGSGSDTLKGGGGLDTMNGEVGNDVYDYDAVSESPNNFYRSDGISFDKAGSVFGDRIDLSTIDANITTVKNDAFDFFGTTAPKGGSGAGKVWVADGFQANFGDITLVKASVDADLAPELLIRVGDGTAVAANWVADDFIL